MNAVVCRVCGRWEVISYKDALAEGWRCEGAVPWLWTCPVPWLWTCPSCAAVDDAIERDVDDAIDRSAS